jgi:DNA-binding SARP family transcriptional activator
MPAGVEIGLLGPLQVRCDGVAVAVPAGKQRALLAALALQEGRPVPAAELAELLWAPDPPPPTAAAALRNIVMRLRRALGHAGQHLIQIRPGGYLITPGDCLLDIDTMERELAAARAAARDGDWERAAERADASLSIWRGEPLSDVDLPALTAQHVPQLNEMRLQARELRIDADLALARHAETLIELPQLIAASPVREHLYAQQMLALYRSGRRAEALDAYRAAHDVLAREIGVDPGPELRALHQQILHDDPALAGPDARRQRSGTVVPRQLPAPARHFAGRSGELAELAGLVDRARQDARPTVVISAIGGLAGIGKTALAVQFARQVAGSFPDGQLYVNLRGYDPALAPMPAAEAIRLALDAFAIPAGRIPASAEAQAGLFRSVLAGKKVLIVLDNAADAAQVRPLLPGSGGCLVIVTSRSKLAGLVATDGAIPMSLGVLTETEACGLLAGILGADRVAAEPEAAGELIGACGRLPLALAITAAQAATSPGLPLDTLAAELAATGDRLDALQAAGDPLASVRAALECSYRHLGADAARMLRLLGMHAGPDISVAAAASLAALPRPQAARHLAELADASLIAQDSDGRCSLHDLVRLYAAEQAQRADSEADRHAAICRMLDHYVHTGHAADRLLNPERKPIAVIAPSPGTVPERLADDRAATSWLEDEHRVLIAAASHAVTHGQDARAWTIAWTLQDYFFYRGHWHDQMAVSTTALLAATRLGDLTLQAKTHYYLAQAANRLGRYDDAYSHYRHSLDLYGQVGDGIGQANAHTGLSLLLNHLGQSARAAEHARQALERYTAGGHLAGRAHALNNLGWNLVHLGDYEQALAYCQQALALSRETGDRQTEAATLDTLGCAHHSLGHHTEAITCCQRALDIAQETGHRYQQAEALSHLGDTLQVTGDLERARNVWRDALVILDDLQHPDATGIRAKLQAADTARTSAAVYG